MLFPEKVYKVVIISDKDKSNVLVSALYNLSILHLEDINMEGFSSKELNKDEQIILEYNLKLNSIFKSLKLKKSFKKIKDIDYSHFLDKKHLIDEIIDKVNKINKIKEDIKKLELLKKNIKILKILDIEDLSNLNLKEFTVFVGLTENEKLKNLHEKKIIFKCNKLENKTFCYVVIKKEDDFNKIKDLFKEIINVKSIQEELDNLNLPNKINLALNELEKLINNLKKEEKTLEKELNDFIQREYKTLLTLKYFLNNEENRIKHYSKLKEGNFSFVLKGFVSSKDLRKLEKVVKKIDPKAVVYIEKEFEKEEAPIKLKNKTLFKGFHKLLEAYGLPKYHSIDPSAIMFFTFPIFYGFIIGDIGYGLVMLLLALLIKRKVEKNLKPLLDVVVLASISSIIFGLIFGEFFGFEKIFSFELHPLLHRMEDIKELIFIALAVGVIHINLGLIFGIINHIKEKKYLEALTHNVSWILLQISVILLFFKQFLIGTVILLISILLLIKGEGFKGIIELPSIFSHILSYIRLAAVGLSSIAIAFVINMFVEFLFNTKNIFLIILGILVFFIGHTFNLLLGVIGAFLHSLRLHYLEFFTKFYKTGGKKFETFGKLEK